MKEADSTITAVLNEIFVSSSRRRAKDLTMGEEEASRYVSRLSRSIEALNNPASIANGIQIPLYLLSAHYFFFRMFCSVSKLP